jgi:hypothetical protein
MLQESLEYSETISFSTSHISYYTYRLVRVTTLAGSIQGPKAYEFKAFHDHGDGGHRTHGNDHGSAEGGYVDGRGAPQLTRPHVYARGAQHAHAHGHVRPLHGGEGGDDVLETGLPLPSP